MALQPALFPEIEGPEFVRSDELERVASDVMDRHGGVNGIRGLFETRRAVVDGEVQIAYMLNTKPFDPMKDDVTHDAIAKCIKAPRLWHDVTGIDVAVWVRAYFWDTFDIRRRDLVALHELLHVEVERDDDGQASVRMRKHDVEEFTDVVRYYGLLDAGREAFVKAFALWEGDGGTPDRGGELHEIGSRFVKKVMRPGSGIDAITISTQVPGEEPKSVTIDRAAADRLRAAADRLRANTRKPRRSAK